MQDMQQLLQSTCMNWGYMHAKASGIVVLLHSPV